MPKKDRPQLILHVGTQKTGSTSIQGFLKTQAQVLAENNLHYLSTGRTNIAHNVMIPMIRKGRGPGLAKRLLGEIDQQEDRTSILSSEMFFRTDIANYFALNFPPEILRNSRVIVYLRRQDKFAEAMYKQRVKNGQFNGPPEAYLARMKLLDYLPTLDRFATVFGKENLIVRPFERRHFADGDVLADFLQNCDAPSTLAKTYDAPSSNATLSREVSEELGRLNREKSGHNTREIIRFLGHTRPDGAILSGDCFDRDTRLALLDSLKTQNELIRCLFCPDQTELFDMQDLEDKAAYKPPTAKMRQKRRQDALAAVQAAISETA